MAAVAFAAAAIALPPAASAVTEVTIEGTTWEVHDDFRPSLDTGSLRSVDDTPIRGYGNIFVEVNSPDAPLFNGQMMRGFGVTATDGDTFESTESVDMGGVLVTRQLDLGTKAARFFDTFTNTTGAPIDVEVSFGGALGYGTGNDFGDVRATASGDLAIGPDDAWTVAATPDDGERPVGTVLGTPAPFAGAITGVGNQERNPFDTPRSTTGHEANFYGYLSTLTIEPGTTESLVRFVVLGPAGDVDATVDAASALAAAPDVDGLTPDELCTIANWDVDVVCDDSPMLDVPPAATVGAPSTTSTYDVVGKTIDDLLTDMESGATTSQEITRAYLDRIDYYDSGPWSFHAYITVAEDAMAQAAAADEARANGDTGGLLGIPIAMKDLFDTSDMPTTGGTAALADWQPETDAHQVALLRDAGAIIIGKANMSEFAFSGGYSESGFGQTWNALYPSKTSFGSSGGSAVAVATSMAAGAFGSQTGVSLYAPAVGASLTTFRGTDGMASVHGVMPLSWGQDYAGPIARSVTDLAHLLNATTGTDPKDILTADADLYRPDDWTESLDADALAGAKIGFLPDSFESSYADDGTGQAVRDQFAVLEAAGATMVEMADRPGGGSSGGGSRAEEGWARYIELHDDFPFANGAEIRADDAVLPYNQRPAGEVSRMTPEQVETWLAYRDNYKIVTAEWMDSYDVDVIVYPGFLSDMYNNDSNGNQLTADRGTGVITSSVGLPTVVVPVGTNPHGYSIAMQLVGRAWDDANVLGLGYALETAADGQQDTAYAPALQAQTDGDQVITVTVPEVEPGEFLWTIDGNGMVDLGDMANMGSYLQATGPIDPLLVTDTRSGGPTWSISGVVSDFAPDGPAGEHLGWTPQVLEDGAGAVAGDPVPSGIDGGDGLAISRTLASADAGHAVGTARVGAALDLRFPVATDPGDYTATLTITALS